MLIYRITSRLVRNEEHEATLGVLEMEKALEEDCKEGSWLLNKDAYDHSWILSLLQRNHKLSVNI